MQDDGSGPSYADALRTVHATMVAQHITGANFSESKLDSALGIQANDPKDVPGADGLTEYGRQYLGAAAAAFKPIHIYGKHAPQMIEEVNQAGRMLYGQGGQNPASFAAQQSNVTARQSATKKLQEKLTILQGYRGELDADLSSLMTSAQDAGLTRFPSWNAVKLAAEKQGGDPKVTAYAMWLTTVRDVYAKILTNQTTGAGVTDFGMTQAINRLPQSANMEQLRAAVDTIKAAAAHMESGFQNQLTSLQHSLSIKNYTNPVDQSGDAGTPSASRDSDTQAFMQVLDHGGH